MKTVRTFVAERPWIWLIVANLFIIGALFTLGLIAAKHSAQFQPITVQAG